MNIRLDGSWVRLMLGDLTTSEDERLEVYKGTHYEMGNTILHIIPSRLDLAMAFRKQICQSVSISCLVLAPSKHQHVTPMCLLCRRIFMLEAKKDNALRIVKAEEALLDQICLGIYPQESSTMLLFKPTDYHASNSLLQKYNDMQLFHDYLFIGL